MGNVIGFHWKENEYSYMSNWYKASFKLGRYTYSCVEQYMMFQKMAMFKMYDVADEILKTEDPAVMKELGQTKSKSFDRDIWEDTCYEVVKAGVLHKFEQNKDIREKLLSTGNAILVECAGSDKKWGNLINIMDESWKDIRNWKGRNLLGRALMEVRDELRRREKVAEITYVDAKDLPANDVWNMTPNEVMHIPTFRKYVNTYFSTIANFDDIHKNIFLNDCSLNKWDIAMKTNMGGGMPIAWFYEMKQEIYDIIRYYCDEAANIPLEEPINKPAEKPEIENIEKKYSESKIELIHASCADQRVDAVVNAANDGLWEGGGICGVIFNKAGSAELTAACKEYKTPLNDGDAVITPSFKMINAKAIIHAVGPDFRRTPEAFKELLDAYYNSMVVLKENGYHSIAFPLISSGIFRGNLHDPVGESTKQCCRAYKKFIRDYPYYPIDVKICVFKQDEMNAAQREFIV